MATRAFIVASILITCLVSCHGEIKLSSLNRTIEITSSHRPGVLQGGEDQVTLKWSFNTSFKAGTDSSYKTVKIKVCYAPVSQKDRQWRKTDDIIKKDKTCQFKVVSTPYKPSNNNYTWTIERDVPTATYFLRAYILNSANEEVAYGQDPANTFDIQAISGRHVTLDICSIVFSVFSVVALFGFFYMEKRKAKASK